jgi:Na+/proline symporter
MTLEVLLFGALIVAALTTLTTEGVKKILKELQVKYAANVLSGAVAIVWAVLIGIAYVILTDSAFNAKMTVYLIALILLSWLVAMNGYDKVIQTIAQVRNEVKS